MFLSHNITLWNSCLVCGICRCVGGTLLLYTNLFHVTSPSYIGNFDPGFFQITYTLKCVIGMSIYARCVKGFSLPVVFVPRVSLLHFGPSIITVEWLIIFLIDWQHFTKPPDCLPPAGTMFRGPFFHSRHKGFFPVTQPGKAGNSSAGGLVNSAVRGRVQTLGRSLCFLTRHS